jgi:hypothetical protein
LGLGIFYIGVKEKKKDLLLEEQYVLQRHGAMQNQVFPGNIPERHAGIHER